MIGQDQLKQNYHAVLERIQKAAASVNRPADEVRLVVVTKGHSAETIQNLVEIGVRDFGENRVEEAQIKIPHFTQTPGIHWHMIGHLQSRKAAGAAELFDVVHSVDRGKIAKRLNDFAKERNETLKILLQFNVSGEATKSGWDAQQESRWGTLYPDIETVLALPCIKVIGLMTMAPYTANPEEARPVFKKLHKLRDFLAKKYPNHDWRELSIGMSDDYEVAVQEGATLVRVGTAILGPRSYKIG